MRNFTKYIKSYLVLSLLMASSFGVLAQGVPAGIGTDITGTYNDTILTQYGLFGQYRTYVANPVVSGGSKVEFPIAAGNFSTVWRAYSGGQTLAGFNQIIDTTQSAAALYNSGFGGSGILLPAVTGGMFYTFNVQTHGSVGTYSDTMAIIMTSYDPVAITNVSIPVDTNTIGPACSPVIVATLAAAPSVGEYFYLRYSTDFFADSSIVIPMTVSGTTATAQIPAYPTGTSIQYYVLSSPIASLITTGPGSGYYDCQTLNLKAGSVGNNFRYTVKTLPVPSVSIVASANPVCQGTEDIFTAHGVNNGTVASDYQWYKNNVHVGTNDSIYSDATLANGDSVWVVMTANLGCPVMDTSSHIIISVIPVSTYTQSVLICHGGTFVENGHTYTAANTYIDTFYNASVTGCDSIVTTILTVRPLANYTQYDTICYGGSFVENGHTYTTANSYIDTFYNASVTGCDSTVTTVLTVRPLAAYTQYDTICQGSSFVENGNTYTNTNTYIDTFTNASVTGCDSIVTTILTVRPLASYTQYDTICQGSSYTENGHSYSATGTYIDTFINASYIGCDSIVTTYLTVNTAPVVTTNPANQSVSAGDTATFTAADSGTPSPNVQWQVSTDGGVTFTNVAGATSVTLTVSGTTIAMSGYEYQAVFTNSCGSATSTSATLTVNNPPLAITAEPSNDTVCAYTTALFTAAAIGSPAPTVQWQLSTDGGTTYASIPGATAPTLSFTTTNTENGYIYWAIFTNGTISDTTTPAILIVRQVPLFTQSPSICQGESIVVNGHTYTTANTYMDTLVNGAVSGCDSIIVTHLSVHPYPVNTIGTGPINQCGGDVVLDAGNALGSTYLWSNGSTAETDTFSSSNVISVTVTNSFGCKDSFSRAAFINTAPVVDLGPAQNVCADSTVLDAGSPGSSYLWTGGSTGQFLTVVSSGTYSVTVTDTSSHCSTSDSVHVTIGAVPLVNLGHDTSICGGSLPLSAQTPKSVAYIWSTGDTTGQIIVSSTGNYSVTVTGTTGCTATGSILVTVYPRPNLGPDVLDSICPSSRADLYSYYVNSGLTLTYSTTTPARVDTGTYTVIGTNSNGCTDTALITIIYRQKPDAGGNKTDSICPGYMYNLTTLYPNTGYTAYQWNTPDPTAVDTGTYMLVVTNPSGCTDTAFAVITQRVKPNLGGNKTDSVCLGYTYDLTALYPDNGYVTYTWTAVTNAKAVSPGVYQLIVSNTSGCTDTAYATIIQKQQPVVTIPAYPNLCSTNPSFPLIGAAPIGGTYYVDYVLDSIFRTAALGPGIHHIVYVYTNAGGCTDSASHDVTIYPQPQIIDTIGFPITCTGSALIDLNGYFSPIGGVYSGTGVSGIYFYPTLAPAGFDSITYIYTDPNGCMDTAARAIQILPAVKVSLHTTQSNMTICAKQPITFIANGAVFYQFFVNDSAVTNADTINIYTTNSLNNHDQVTVVGSNGCSTDTSDYIIIDVIPTPTVTVGPDTTIQLGQSVQLYSIVSGVSSLVYLWTPDSSLSVATIPNPVYSGSDSIILQLTVSDDNGCVATAFDTINVYVPDNVVLPNVITPNGDGKNDQWVLNPKIDLVGSHLVIFNRWGEVVYETWNYANDWGGTYKSTGQKVPDGTYYYVLTVPAQDNHTYKGPINVLNSEGN